MIDRLHAKLDPTRFPNMSGQMAAILGLLLDRAYTEPALAEVMVTPDGAVPGRLADRPDRRMFIGAEADLRANWCRPGMAAGLDEPVWAAYRERVRQRLGIVLDPPAQK